MTTPRYKLVHDSIDVRLDDVYSKMYELTQEEPCEELREYNEYLLDSIQEAIIYIHHLEKKIPKPVYTLEEINRLNRKYNK